MYNIDTKYAYLYFSVFKVAYFGKAADTLDYFEAIGLPCAIHFNPADFLRTYTKSSILKQNMIGSYLKSLRIPEGYSDSTNRRTDNTMAKR